MCVNVDTDYAKEITNNIRYEWTRCVSEITITIANLQLNVTLSNTILLIFLR